MAAVQRRWTVAVAVMVLAVAASTARGQVVSPAAAPAPAGGIDSACLNSLLNMPDCLPYVQKGSTARRPDKPCCPELAGLVDSNPVCLCELLSGAADSYGIAVDYSRALALPGICHIATPPVSTCADARISHQPGLHYNCAIYNHGANNNDMAKHMKHSSQGLLLLSLVLLGCFASLACIYGRSIDGVGAKNKIKGVTACSKKYFPPNRGWFCCHLKGNDPCYQTSDQCHNNCH